MNVISLPKFRKSIQQYISDNQSSLDIGSLWYEYCYVNDIASDSDNAILSFDVVWYSDWLVKQLVNSSTIDDGNHCVDYDNMLYVLSDIGENNKRITYLFDTINWTGSREELDDVVLPVLEQMI